MDCKRLILALENTTLATMFCMLTLIIYLVLKENVNAKALTVSKHFHLITKTKKCITSKIMFLLTLQALVTPEMAFKHTNSKLE